MYITGGIKMYFDDLKIGMNIDIFDVLIKEEEMIEFSYKYDNVPLIHTSKLNLTNCFSEPINNLVIT